MSQKPDDAFIGDKPTFTDVELELARHEQSWCDFVYSVRTRMRFRCNDDGVATHCRAMTFAQVTEQFDIYKNLIDGDDPSALVSALYFACQEGMPLPYWLSKKICSAIEATFKTETTLHEAFGLSTMLPEKGKKAGTARRRIPEGQILRREVKVLMHQHKNLSLDAALRRVLKEGSFSFGLGVARQLFNERDQKQRLFLGKKEKRL